MDHWRHEPVVLKQFAICFNSFALFVDSTINKKNVFEAQEHVLTVFLIGRYFSSPSRDVASPLTFGPGPTNFWFNQSTACNKLCVVGVSWEAQELTLLVRSECTIFSISENESQPGLQLMKSWYAHATFLAWRLHKERRQTQVTN